VERRLMIEALLAGAALFTSMGCLYAWKEAQRIKARLWDAEVQAAEWQRKYEQLVEDLKRKVGEPRVVVETREVAGVRKARSSAEVRRVFEEINGRE
jgi:hypothetical protein